jgi:hypothetical protein
MWSYTSGKRKCWMILENKSACDSDISQYNKEGILEKQFHQKSIALGKQVYPFCN